MNLLRHLLHDMLLKLFEKSYAPSLYIKLATSLYSIPEKVEHQAEIIASPQEVLQGVLNSSVIPFHLSRIWPYWVYRQLNPQSPHFSCSGLPALSLNTTHRNWTTLSYPGINEQAIVDPAGLITPLPNGWSLDFWVTYEDRLVIPALVADLNQSLIKNRPITYTTFSLKHSISVCSEAWFASDMHQQGYVFNQISVTNHTQAPLETSLFLAIRPYNPEGIAPIQEITYLSQQGFVVDNRLGVVLDQAPDNVVCLTFSDGDVATHYKEWEMILSAQCANHMASAFAEYRIKLAPGEEKTISCKLPTTPISPLKKLFNRALTKPQHENLIQKIKGTRAFDTTEIKTQFFNEWDSLFEPLGQLSLPDTPLQTLLIQNMAHLQSFVGKDRVFSGGAAFQGAKLSEKVYLILSLNRSGAHAVSEKLLLQMPYFQKVSSIRHLNGEQAGHLLYALYDTYQYSHNLSLIEEHFAHIETLVKKIKGYTKKWSPHRSFNEKIAKLFGGYTSQEEYLYRYFWAMTGLRRATTMATILQKEEQSSYFNSLHQEMSSALNMLLLFSMGSLPSSHFVPVSTKRLVDAGLVMSLAAVYPLGIISPDDERITQTLTLLEQFLVNKILFNSVGYAGYNVFQNCQLAQVYALRKDPKAWDILTWIITNASPTGTWPEFIHPISLGGSGGDGHSALACAEVIHLVRNLIVRKEGKILHFCPFIPAEWLEGDGITANQWPTPFGTCRFTLTKENNQVTFRLETDFSYTPDEIRLSIPIPFKTVHCGGFTLNGNLPYITLDPRSQEVVFDL